jgi:endogenous inhibitor of DNA gyrase (YacG/DUF329 family)
MNKKDLLCPYCKKNPSAPAPLWPFCSARCKTNDLGHWAKEDYRIAGKTPDSEEEVSLLMSSFAEEDEEDFSE